MPNSVKQSASLSSCHKEHIQLAREAAENIAASRKKVNELLAPIIQYQTNRFCKRFCKENRSLYKCTLKPPIGYPPADASLCEWGNGSYAWMLDDLSSAKRLLKYQGKNNASLFDYCYVIANSLPFYERWKDWRFGRKTYVPSYIRTLGELAVSVFYGLYAEQSVEQISQSTSQPVDRIKQLSREIIRLLTNKNRLYLLNSVQTISFTQETSEETHASLQAEIASFDEDHAVYEEKQKLAKAWGLLSPVEQFVTEALIIEEQDAMVVLNSLKKLNLTIKEGVSANDIDRQQLYYFRRKTLSKLNALMKQI